nr:virulence RhuM family protein [Hyphomonas sp.]
MSEREDSRGELILYRADDGAAEIQLRAIAGRVWLSLSQIADLFERDKSVISRHIKAVFDEGELTPDSVVARYATTAADGKTYQVEHYALEMILAVGYRVRSARGVQFRQWATARLKDYLVKHPEVILEVQGALEQKVASEEAERT